MHHAMINKGKMINKERLAEFPCCTKAQAAGRGQAAAGVGMVQAHTAWAGAVLWAPPGTQEMAQGHCWGTAAPARAAGLLRVSPGSSTARLAQRC